MFACVITVGQSILAALRFQTCIWGSWPYIDLVKDPPNRIHLVQLIMYCGANLLPSILVVGSCERELSLCFWSITCNTCRMYQMAWC